MKPDRDVVPESQKNVHFARAAGLLAAILLLSGCSAVPDWANPVEWYEGAADAIYGSDKPESNAASDAKAPAKAPGDGKNFPNLASVPERPTATSAADRKKMANSLTADRDNARYSDEVIRRQSAASIPPPPPPPPSPSYVNAPPKQAVPVAPVARPVTRPAAPAVSRPAAPAASRPGAKAMPAAPAGSTLLTPPVSRPPQFNSRPARPAAPSISPSTGSNRTIRSRATRPSPSSRSIARVGNPTFGAPPADIAAALNAGTPPAAFEAQPEVVGTLSSASATAATGQPVATVRFKAGSAILTKNGRSQLRQIASMYRQRGGAIRVEGHASSRTRNMDPVQHHLVNFNVSLDRANVVAGELMRQGVPVQAVFVAAMSDSRPLYSEVMPAGDAGNQRVEIRFVN